MEKKATRPVCSVCRVELEAGGFRVKFEKDAQLYVGKCSVCGHRLPVHDAQVLGRKTPKPNRRA